MSKYGFGKEKDDKLCPVTMGAKKWLWDQKLNMYKDPITDKWFTPVNGAKGSEFIEMDPATKAAKPSWTRFKIETKAPIWQRRVIQDVYQQLNEEAQQLCPECYACITSWTNTDAHFVLVVDNIPTEVMWDKISDICIADVGALGMV